MAGNEISSGRSNAAPLCGNFIRCSITSKTAQQTSSGNTLMFSLNLSCNYSCIQESIHRLTKKKKTNPLKTLDEEQLLKDWMKMQIYDQKFSAVEITNGSRQWLDREKRNKAVLSSSASQLLEHFFPLESMMSTISRCPEAAECCCWCEEALCAILSFAVNTFPTD